MVFKSAKPLSIQGKFPIYQSFRSKAPVFSIGYAPHLAPGTYRNPIKEALQYQRMLDDGTASSQADLARLLGVSRAKVTQVLNLLKLDEEIQEFILGMEDTDERLKVLTERRLRDIVDMPRPSQKETAWGLLS